MATLTSYQFDFTGPGMTVADRLLELAAASTWRPVRYNSATATLALVGGMRVEDLEARATSDAPGALTSREGTAGPSTPRRRYRVLRRGGVVSSSDWSTRSPTAIHHGR